MHYRVYITLIFLALGTAARSDEGSEIKIKSAFLYQFSKFIEWTHKPNPSFTILVVGNTRFVDALEGYAASGKLFAGLPMKVESSPNNVHLSKPQMIVIDSPDEALVVNSLKAAKGCNCLIVTNAPGFTSKGATVSFINREDATIGFSINSESAKRENLNIGSQLLKLSIEDSGGGGQ